MKQRRNKSKDSLKNIIEFYVLTHFKWFWQFVQRFPKLTKIINKALVNGATYKGKCRPLALSTMAPYSSLESLTDLSYYARYLPPVAIKVGTLPPIDAVAQLFLRPPGKVRPCFKTTVLFSYFAEWFLDGFLHTDPTNNLKTQEIDQRALDLGNLYGFNKKVTSLLRSYDKGKLKSQFINGEEYSPFYYQEDGIAKKEFQALPVEHLEIIELTPKKKLHSFVMGSARGNTQLGFIMFNTLFLREHNRLCDVLSKEYSDWDDERLFQTARNILVVLLIKLTIEEYVNHISPYHFKIRFDPTANFYKEKWYQPNRLPIEFNLLYRWHSLVPDYSLSLEGKQIPITETLYNQKLLIDKGLGRSFEEASLQPAGELGLFNTPAFLIEIEKRSIKMGRDAQLASYNDYRACFGMPRVTDFNQITGDKFIQKELKKLYNHVDNIEFYVGLFAADARKNTFLSELMDIMVAIDAFSQTMPNPLLTENVYNEATFSPLGFNIIKTTNSFSELLHRNVPPTQNTFKVSFTQEAWLAKHMR